jgi:hydrogenase nickel incorporation protein HypB
MKIPVVKQILEANDRIADQNRAIFDEKGLLVINLMSSPGAGKTTLLEKTIDALKDALRIGVIEGDIQSTHDAERIALKGVPAVQINTGGACHLDGNTPLRRWISATLIFWWWKTLGTWFVLRNSGSVRTSR